MDIEAIMEHLPHRYPFLLVDRVVEIELGKSIHAYKNVTINEPFFMGHFPHHAGGPDQGGACTGCRYSVVQIDVREAVG